MTIRSPGEKGAIAPLAGYRPQRLKDLALGGSWVLRRIRAGSAGTDEA
jgi:hypothetical protein